MLITLISDFGTVVWFKCNDSDPHRLDFGSGVVLESACVLKTLFVDWRSAWISIFRQMANNISCEIFVWCSLAWFFHLVCPEYFANGLHLGIIHARNRGVAKVVHKILSEHDLPAHLWVIRHGSFCWGNPAVLEQFLGYGEEAYFLAFRSAVRGPTISTKFPSGSFSISRQTSWGRPLGRIWGLLP